MAPSIAPTPTTARRRRWSGALIAVAAVLSLVGSLAAVGVAEQPAAAGRGYGDQPIDDVLYWAGQYANPACGLSMPQLASMMVVPTFGETGATTSQAPGPMTLSRWDTQPALWAFGNTATPYQRAFWHPGVGMWQFDSAGYWDMTAADAINTSISARFAAQVMASRYCASGSSSTETRMRYAWAPWFTCASTNTCLDIYHQIYDGSRLTLDRIPGVTRLGGMQPRTCAVPSIGTVPCHRVDPALAEGARGWTSTNPVIPTPLTAPFYVFRANGQEYRYWLAQDSGYDATIIAHKPVTANARTSLSWAKADASTALCDVTTGAGTCAGWTDWESVPGAWSGDTSIAVNADGRLEALMVGADGSVKTAWQIIPSGPWAGPATIQGLGGARSVVARRGPDGWIHAFALDASGTVFEAQQSASGWTSWTSLGGGVAGSLDVGENADGRLELYAVSSTSDIIQQWQQGGGGWSGWHGTGTLGATHVSVVSNADGRLEVFARFASTVLAQRWQLAPNGSWSGWKTMGSGIAGRPAVVRNLDGRLELFARTSDGSIVDTWQFGPNTSWSSMVAFGGERLAGDPVAAINRDGRLELFGRTADGGLGTIWQLWANGHWATWARRPGVSPSALASGRMADGRLLLYLRSGDGTVVRSNQRS